ncbi:MAG: hypothetical protein PVI11_01550 [Candidatus Aminicenantes bacterium]|jgi:photosystem II stability/assembly factor-like uncharacterized protein
MKRCIYPFLYLSLFFLCVQFLSPLGASLQDKESPTDPESRMKSWDLHEKLREESPFKNLKWRRVGPMFQGGRIESIACPAGSDSTIFVGVGSGNVWKTVNNGMTWKPIFENESTFAIGDIEVSRSDADTVWVGTGENLMARSSFAGTGIFKSQDGGQTWKNMGLHDSHHIGRIVIDPQNPDIVYVAVLGHQYTYNEERGLFKTTDGGKTWKKSLFISEKVGVVDVVMDPSDNETLYAAAWERDRKAWDNVVCGKGSGIYKTTDAGSTWKRLTKGFPTGKYIGRIGLDVSVSNSNVVYAVLDNQTPLPRKKKERRQRHIGGEVYCSEDKGRTWKKVNESDVIAGINYSFGDIRVSPDDEKRIYVLGVNLAVSEDGGKTYKRLGGTVVRLYHHSTRALHLDHHDLWIDPVNPDRLLLGNDGGFFMSYDRGKTWLHINNLPIAEFYALSVDMASPYNIYGGTQDDSALYGPSDQEQEDGIEDSWKHVWIDLWGGGDSYFTLVDPTDLSIIYYEQQFGYFRRKNMKTGQSKHIQPRAKKGEPPLRYNWMTPFIISHHNPFTLYYGANKLFKSVNRGDNWTCISPDLSTSPGPEKQGNVPYGALTTISESPLLPGLIYVGTDDGNVHVTRDDGKNWTKINEDLPDKWVSRVVASSHELGTVYLSLTGYREDDFEAYLYRSTDFGQTWNSITGNLPSESVNVIREDPQNKNILYVGTDQGGIYVSLDSGETWYSLCCDLPTTAVHDIAVHPRDSELVIGTHGRSAFVLDIAPVQEFDGKISEKEAHLFAIRQAVLPRSRDYRGDWAWETRKKAVIHYYLKESCPVEISILDDAGEVLRELTGTNDSGVNRAVWDLSPKKEEADQAVFRRGTELVKPGNYTVVIRAGNSKLEGNVQVKPPR